LLLTVTVPPVLPLLLLLLLLLDGSVVPDLIAGDKIDFDDEEFDLSAASDEVDEAASDLNRLSMTCLAFILRSTFGLMLLLLLLLIDCLFESVRIRKKEKNRKREG
jgi:hypothetical protein